MKLSRIFSAAVITILLSLTVPVDRAAAGFGVGLTVSIHIIPTNDPGRFNLQIDGVNRAVSVGNGGTTGSVSMSMGTHGVSVTPGTGSGTNLAQYTIMVGGDCGPGGTVLLGFGQHRTCIVTAVRKPLWTHGTWTRGPGTYSFSVCAYGTQCDLIATAGQAIPVKAEAWGAGGGGGGGGEANHQGGSGGNGGGGGGGGGYATTTTTIVVPNGGGTQYYTVHVGAGGHGGAKADPAAGRDGGTGGNSDAQLGSGQYLYATGGTGGKSGKPGSNGTFGGIGFPGSGDFDNWAGTAGYPGAPGLICTGGGEGLGGAGGGPGRTGPGYINEGGVGGHGGYLNKGLISCNKHGTDYLLAPGAPGGNGKVTFTW